MLRTWTASVSAGVMIMAVGALASGCLIGKTNRQTETGVKVTGNTLGQVQPGHTSEAWVIATLGEPTSRRAVDERTQILRYDHTTTVKKGGYVFLLYAGGESKKETSSVLFEITDGVVTRYWTEV